MDIRIISKDDRNLLNVGNRDIKTYGRAVVLIEGNNNESLSTVGIYANEQEAREILKEMTQQIIKANEDDLDSIIINMNK